MLDVMNCVTDTARCGGFTLVELLIVVLVLSIIAAIVVPQLAQSSDDAKVAALQTDLARMRSAIDLYYQEHGYYPGDAPASGATCPAGGTAGVGTATGYPQRATAFAEQLAMFTNSAGQACSTTDGTFRYGPYIRTAELGEAGIPSNPVTASNAIKVTTLGNLTLSSTSAEGGWKYDPTIGKLIADHQDFDDL